MVWGSCFIMSVVSAVVGANGHAHDAGKKSRRVPPHAGSLCFILHLAAVKKTVQKGGHSEKWENLFRR